MSAVDWIVLAAVGLTVGAAAFFTLRLRKKGRRCCGDCSGCAARCDENEKTADRI